MAEVLVGISKVGRYASRDSGDTVEVVERPSGGLSVVIADAQGMGLAAKLLSNLVTAKAVALLKEGARDTAVHEAVHDHLYHYKGGRVSCTLTTVSVDTRRGSCTVTRNSPTPAYVAHPGVVLALDGKSSPLGIGYDLSPVFEAEPLRPGLSVVVVTDGVSSAGVRSGCPLDVAREVAEHLDAGREPAEVARCLLDAAVERDQNRPADDMTVVVLGVRASNAGDERRTLQLRVPLRDHLPREEEGGGG